MAAGVTSALDRRRDLRRPLSAPALAGFGDEVECYDRHAPLPDVGERCRAERAALMLRICRRRTFSSCVHADPAAIRASAHAMARPSTGRRHASSCSIATTASVDAYAPNAAASAEEGGAAFARVVGGPRGLGPASGRTRSTEPCAARAVERTGCVAARARTGWVPRCSPGGRPRSTRTWAADRAPGYDLLPQNAVQKRASPPSKHLLADESARARCTARRGGARAYRALGRAAPPRLAALTPCSRRCSCALVTPGRPPGLPPRRSLTVGWNGRARPTSRPARAAAARRGLGRAAPHGALSS